jgi:cobaltochelatase CobN
MEIEGDIEDTYGDIDIGEFQGGSIDIDMIWKEKLKEKY